MSRRFPSYKFSKQIKLQMLGSMSSGNWALISAERQDVSPETNFENTLRLRQDLIKEGYHPVSVVGRYQGQNERAWYVLRLPEKDAIRLGKKYNQESILTDEGLFLFDKGVVVPIASESGKYGGEATTQISYAILGKSGRVAVSVPLDFNKAKSI